MRKHPHLILVFLNILIVIVLYGDITTSSFPIPENFERFYESKEKYGRNSHGRKRYEIHNFLKCQSGNIYQLAVIPEIEITPGTLIEIHETKYLERVKSLSFGNSDFEKVNLSILFDPYILSFAFTTIIISTIYIFKRHALIEYVLWIFSGITYAMTFVYLHYL